MQHLRSKVFIRFLISLLLTGLVGGLFLSSRTVWSQGPSILSDDFNDNWLDTAKWNANSLFSGYIDLNLPIVETGQRLEIGPLLLNTPDSHYRGIRSVNTYNFSGAYTYVELVQPASSATKADAMFTVGNDVNNYYRLYVSEGTLYGLRKAGGTKTTLFTLPYDAVNHRFLRIRHDATIGSVTLDTAPASGAAPGSWVQRYSEIWSSSISLTGIIFEVKGGTWQPEANAPGKVIFDNFRVASNLGSPPRVSAISPNSGTINGGTSVNITGSGFVSGAIVNFGGSLASNVAVLSSSFIIATTTAHSASTVDVVVTNSDGQSGTLASAYTYSSAPPPQTGLLADDFNDNSLDTAKWNPNSLFSGYIDLNLPLVETGQRLEIGPLLLNTPDSHYRGIRSVNTYNFSGAYTYVELVQPASSATKADAMFTVGNDVNNYYRLYVSEGTLYGQRKIGGTKTTLFSLPYDAVNHRFLRIRHDAATGNVTLDTAPGSGAAPGSWVQRYSEVWNASVLLTATIFELKGGTWQPEANAPGKVIFDNFSAAIPSSGGGGASLPPLAALLDPMNRTGGSGENPLSRNFNFSVPLLGLPGRAGLDLNLSLSYNSLIWLNTGSAMSFDEDGGFPSPGFRLGFPVMQIRTNPETFKASYLLIAPDGSRTELRKVSTSSLYESTDSSYLLFDASTMILRTADGTQFSFDGALQCTQIKDSNGNFITINYTGFGRVDTVVDTLARTIKFNYDASQYLESITQTWTINGQPQPHTWASFVYADITFQTNFPDLSNAGPPNGSNRKMLTQITVNDGSRFNFEYTSWGQVWKIRNHASDGHLLNYRSYDLPLTNAVPHSDCPRFKERHDWAENWNRGGAPGPSGLPSGPEQEVITRYDVPTNVSWTPPNGSLETGTLAKVTAPDFTYQKIYFAGTEQTSGWRRRLPALVETYDASHELKRQVVTIWTQDNTSSNYEFNPRVIETNTYDPAGNRAKVVVGYQSVNIGDGTSCKLPQDIYEYQADATTVVRRTHMEYNPSPTYKERRIIGLPSEKTLYEYDLGTQAQTLMSKVGFGYDESPIDVVGPPVQHDNLNFGTGFLSGRANLTSVQRFDVTNLSPPTTTNLKYNRAGAIVSSKDPLNHEVTVDYTDAFAANGTLVEPNRFTFAYPTMVTDPDGYTSKVRYNYDFGAQTWNQTPRPNEVANLPGPEHTFAYDLIGRLVRTTNLSNNAFTRYNYGPNYIDTFSSVNTIVETANEGHILQVFDGHGRVIASASDHPNSTPPRPTPTGDFSAQLVLYDQMGRVQKRSNPTETSLMIIPGTPINPSQFSPLGDDAIANGGFEWKYTEQTYDWKGRPLVTTNQDGTTRTAEYTGCGCAGGEQGTLTDEGTIQGGTFKRRQQKIYSDVIGRVWKTEVLNWQGGSEYSTTVNTYNARDQLTLVRQFQGPGPVDPNNLDCPVGSCQKWESGYDGFGRLETQHQPEQQVDPNNPQSTDHTEWTYNPDDTIQVIKDARGATTTFTYNNGRHLPNIVTHALTGANTIVETFVYDAAQNRTSMVDASGSTSYEYDELSRLESETRAFTGLSGSYSLSYVYNFANQLRKITDPTNMSINYNYDEAGRITSVLGSGTLYAGVPTYATDFSYRASGQRKSIKDGTGRIASLTYNARLRPISFQVSGGLLTQMYSYFDDGRIRQVQSAPNFDFDRAFSYDHLGRLIQATTGGVVRGDSGGVPYHETMGYDPWSNLTARSTINWSESTFSDSASYTNNRRPDWGYDADGRIKTIGSRSYTYNSASQESSMNGQRWTPSGYVPTTLTTSYDGDGNSTKRVWAGVVSYQLRSSVLGGAIVNELTSSGQKQAGYVYYPNGRELATQNNNHVIWKHVSPINTTKIEVHHTGFWEQVELDPAGAFVELSPPSEPPQTQSGEINARNVGALMNSMYAALNNPSSGCVVDRRETSCSEAMGYVNFGTGGNTSFTANSAVTGKEMAEAVLLGMRPRLAPVGESAGSLNVSGLEGTPGRETLEWQWVTYQGQTTFVPVPTAYSGMIGTLPSIVGLTQTVTPITFNAKDVAGKATEIMGKKNCSDFLIQLMNSAQRVTSRKPEASSIPDVVSQVMKQGSIVTGDTIMKFYGVPGATVHGSLSQKTAQIELALPAAFQSYQPPKVHARAAAGYAEDQSWLDAQMVIHEAFHLAGYSDGDLMRALADIRKVDAPDYSKLSTKERILSESRYWTPALRAACPPVR